ncbi:MAG TPA: cobalamin biosynthesis protein CbiD [Candidatus Avacidaminococcus intestinavium]|uniref:Cobalt-precorrin-5B C(1)-methyltransferase n=1 Tax=Candidatus Avacidaminococcus intestinavium TaxID=2840684 RepID=A0A9D1MN32_9FIRM|nr:cobalamin biosynthesis protein CbiD [Candidatus Avacidaminococcus intestinavium]
MEEYKVFDGKKLRYGYTTGSCATAAAKAATEMLLSRQILESISIETPKGVELFLTVEEIDLNDDFASCAIRKDAGDDPDDTNGILIFAKVKKSVGHDVKVHGGLGVGKVTKPGLACAVGEPAINPVPLKMIKNAVKQVSEKHGYLDGLSVTICAPEGVKIAPKTFNPRLGIIGGISILGTSGIVEPMSEKALVDTIYVEMNVQASKGNKDLLVFFGNYGQDFTKDQLGIDISNAVTCSNFVGELLDYAVFKEFESVLLIGHAGKLVKLAQGVMNTHSKYADCRTEILALEALLAGATVDVGQQIVKAPTTDEAFKILRNAKLAEKVLQAVTARIEFYMQQRVHSKLKTGAIIFSNTYGVLGETVHAQELVEKQKK